MGKVTRSGLVLVFVFFFLLLNSELTLAKYRERPISTPDPLSAANIANTTATCEDTGFGEQLAANEIANNEGAVKFLTRAREQICPMLLRKEGRKQFTFQIRDLHQGATRIQDTEARTKAIEFVQKLLTLGRNLEAGCNRYVEYAEMAGGSRQRLFSQLKAAQAGLASQITSGSLATGTGQEGLTIDARNTSEMSAGLNSRIRDVLRDTHHTLQGTYLDLDRRVKQALDPEVRELQAAIERIDRQIRVRAQPILEELASYSESLEPFGKNVLHVLENDMNHLANQNTCLMVASGQLSEADARLEPLSDYEDIPVRDGDPEGNFGAVIPNRDRGRNNDFFLHREIIPQSLKLGAAETIDREMFAGVDGKLGNDGSIRLDTADSDGEVKTAGIFDDLIDDAKSFMGYGTNNNLIDSGRVSKEYIREVMTGDLPGVSICSDRNDVSNPSCVPNNPNLIREWMEEHRPEEYQRRYLDRTKDHIVVNDPLRPDPFGSSTPTTTNDQLAWCLMGFGSTCEAEINNLGIVESATRYKDFQRVCVMNPTCRSTGPQDVRQWEALRIQIMQGNGGIEPTEQDYLQFIHSGNSVRT